MKKLVNFLSGKKTYLITLAAVVYAITGVISGNFTNDQAFEIVFAALGLGSLRAGISKK
jgi:hypothetical protein